MPFQIKIVSHQVKDDKVTYTITVTDTLNGNSRTLKYRYSQLKDMHEELYNIIDKLKLPIQLPQFPRRKLFGATNKNEEAILERKKQLHNYLLSLIVIEKLYNLELFKNNFLPDPKNEKKEGGKLEEQNINVQMYIDRYTIVEDVVLYYARLRDLKTHQQWIFKYRYSDFRNLHQALQKSKVRFLPDFPKKKIFGITNDSPQDIEKRREELERYFNQIFASKQLQGNSIVRFFIEDTKKQAEKQLLIQKARKEKKRVSAV